MLQQEQIIPEATGMSPDVVNVLPEVDFSLILTFESGERKRFNMLPYIGRSAWFEELRDWSYFSLVRPEFGTVVWPHGQDLCPDTLYLNSTPIESPEQ
ncbi:MAG: DUF2442 domain-containing protein [Planctomycetaceae bacterium]|jgi:hypothetical protein|nr:DUF2442 domain-containing protein [Planctomycetaceae bacterium]